MILAELEVFHNRPFAPTRRLALGFCELPTEPEPGFGPLLLGALVAVGAEDLDRDDLAGVLGLMDECEHGLRVVQPRLRHRYQVDRHGLARSSGRLLAGGEEVELDVDGHASPLQMTLAAVYAAARFPAPARPRAYAALRKGLRWRGVVDRRLFTHLAGRDGVPALSVAAYADPTGWALSVLDLAVNGSELEVAEVQRRFRELLREAHPDHGGESAGAAERIAELTEARRILLDR
ncbi:MAG: hypothetical protein ACT4PW_11320 [Acidimicrobiia bacterium]